MQVGELGFAGEANFAQDVTGLNLLAFRNDHRAFFHVAILGFPAAGMAEENAVTAFAAVYIAGAGEDDV